MTTGDARKQFDYPVLEYFASDKADFGMSLGLQRQMLAPAETDFEPNRCSLGAEEDARIDAARRRYPHRHPRQKLTDEALLSRAKRAATTASVEGSALAPLRISGC